MPNGIALYAGSFDPLTNGHMYVIEQAHRVFDQLIVVIGVNPNKPNSYFTIDERVEMIKQSVKHLAGVEVRVNPDKFLIYYAKSVGASFIVRGIRSQKDFSDELELCYYNLERDGSIVSWYLIPPPNLVLVSSSFVKGQIGYDNWQAEVAKYVPRPVYVKIMLRNDALVAELRDRWLELCERIGGEEGSNKYLEPFNDICAKYLERHRFYHTLPHINYGLEKLDQHRHLAKQPDLIEFAWWLHDLAYDVYSTANEFCSAQAAYDMIYLSLGFPRNIAETVFAYIIATTHKEDPVDPDGQLMLDIDLLSLSEPWPVFAADSANIRQEYAHVPDEVFNRERARILRAFLERPQIYYTHEIRAEREIDARANLTESMIQLIEGR